jgi:phage shock protein A
VEDIAMPERHAKPTSGLRALSNRLRAILAVFDEALQRQPRRNASHVDATIRADVDVPRTLAILAREQAQIEVHVEELRRTIEVERMQMSDWERRAKQTATDGRADLAAPALERYAKHRSAVELGNAELDEYMDLAAECREIVDVLRRRSSRVGNSPI